MPIPGLIPLSRKRFASEAANHSPLPIPHSAFPCHLFAAHSPNLNEISSPYLAGILDAADEQMLLLETIRGCIFKCKFCYYPKSYDDLYFVVRRKNRRQPGARPAARRERSRPARSDAQPAAATFAEFLRLLAGCNPDRQFTYFGELRAEGITPEVARLLYEAGFDEVEIGLQSIDPLAMELMDRHNNLRAFERGARAMLDLGIKVKVDLIIGLPGDTVDSVRRGIEYVRNSGLYTQVQVFNLAVLPGTSFRQEAEQLGLRLSGPPAVLRARNADAFHRADVRPDGRSRRRLRNRIRPAAGIRVASGRWSVVSQRAAPLGREVCSERLAAMPPAYQVSFYCR